MSSISPGTQFGRFRVVRMIAQGGMAEVYRAEQELAEGIWRPAALKVIRPEYSESADFREMFLDEARTACTLAHPNIVHIYEVGEAEGRLYMGMELVNGESLSNVARVLRGRNERLSDEALLAIGLFTCSALEAVHALKLGTGHLNLVHRDVSPHNLLLSASGALKLIDFGIAKASTNRNLTHAGVTKGKAGYFSPEQAMGKPLDGRSDLFSLGVALYKLAVGVTPFDQHKNHLDRNTALVHGRWEPLESVCPGLPQGFYEVVERSLAVDREDRYANAREMREALEQTAFEVGVHISQSSLLGYVEENDSEISISPISPVRRRTQAATRRVTLEVPSIEPLASVEGSPIRRKLVAISVAMLLGIGATAVISLTQREAARPGETHLPIAAAPVSPSPQAPVAEVPAAPEKPAEIANAREPFEPAALDPTPTPVEARPRVPPRKPRVISAKASAVNVAQEPPAPVTGGIGKLRMNDPPDFQVTIAGKKNQSPFNVNLPSGLHKAVIASPDGAVEAQCEIPVHPDRATRLRFDAAQKRCTLD